MSSKAIARALESGLPPNLRMVAVGMADDASSDGWAFCSIETIEANTGYSRRHVIDLQKELAAVGAIRRCEPTEMPQEVRVRYEAIPANRRPVAYQLMFVPEAWTGVQSSHPTTDAAATNNTPPQPPHAVPEAPSGVNHAAPLPEGPGVQPSHPSESESPIVGVHSGVHSGVHTSAPNGEGDTKNSPSLRSGERPVAAQLMSTISDTLDDDGVRRSLLRFGFTESDTQPWKFTRADGNVDLLWETLVAVTGADATSFTPTGRKSFNTALEELRSSGASPTQMILRGRRMFRRWKRRPTAHELKKHWAEYADAADDQLHVGESRRADLKQRVAAITGGRS